MNKSTTVEAERPTAVAQFQARYTCLEGDGVYPAEGLDDAARFCESALAWQEENCLPEDARVWVRVGGGAWEPWGGEACDHPDDRDGR